MATKRQRDEEDTPEPSVPAVRSNTSLATSDIPEYLQKYAKAGAVGLEGMSSEDYVMPRLGIAQAMSPQVTKGDPLFIKGLEVGQFFNTLTNEIYGDGPLLTVPLFSFKSRIFFPPRGSDEAIRCTANRVEEGRLVGGRITPEGCDLCPHSKFLDTPRPDGSTRPDCTLFYNYVVVLPKQGGIMIPLALSLKSKMIKPAKKWNSQMRYRNLPAFVQMYELGTTPEKTPKGTFYNITINGAGNVSADLVAQTEQLFSQWSNRNINFDTRGIDKEFDADEFAGRDVSAEM